MRTEAHARCVNSWLEGRAGGAASAERLATHLHAALAALWARARTSLGEVTLAAIFHRVFETTKSSHALLERIRLRVDGGTTVALDTDAARDLDGAALSRAARDVLVELLDVLGRVTGETLTPALHAELASVAGEEATATEHLDVSTKKERGRR